VTAAFFIFLAGCSQQVTFSVPDMMCEEGCAVKVNEILAEQPGVKRVRVDFPNRAATVGASRWRFDSEAALAALVDHGFENSRLAASQAAVGGTGSPSKDAQDAATQLPAEAVR
jgi:copper chaperone CopZ